MELFQFQSDQFELFLTVALAHFLALLSPGPDFIIIVKSALKNRHAAFSVVAGITVANALYIALCLLGVGALLAESAELMLVTKLLGGSFLLYLASQAIKVQKTDYQFVSGVEAPQTSNSSGFIQEFSVGFLSGILNPKNLLFYLSLFSLVLTPDVNLGMKITLGLWMTAIVFIWDAIIILLLFQSQIRSRFVSAAFYIDKCSALLLGSLGAGILHSSLSETIR